MKLDELKTLRLLVAVDGSTSSIKAIQKAADLAKDSVAYEIVIIHVIETWDFPTQNSDVEEESKESRAKAVLDQMLGVAIAEGIEAKAVLLKGSPSQEVLNYAEEFNPNMILVGDRGMNVAKNAPIGSVSSNISKRAKHPVLIVRSE